MLDILKRVLPVAKIAGVWLPRWTNPLGRRQLALQGEVLSAHRALWSKLTPSWARHCASRSFRRILLVTRGDVVQVPVDRIQVFGMVLLDVSQHLLDGAWFLVALASASCRRAEAGCGWWLPSLLLLGGTRDISYLCSSRELVGLLVDAGLFLVRRYLWRSRFIPRGAHLFSVRSSIRPIRWLLHDLIRLVLRPTLAW